ncbi:MAG: nitroreductase/quinone reductase family protein [Thermomicrobiales bacterium]
MSSPAPASRDRNPGTYKKPPGFVSRVMNPMLIFVQERLGIAPWGTEVLAVRGRTSGQIRKAPVNPLSYDGEWYLFSPRGDSEWVRNLRVAGEGTLTRGRHVRRFRVAVEVADAEKPPVIRAYMQKWGKQVASIVGFDADASDAVLAEVAPKHPVFRIEIVVN